MVQRAGEAIKKFVGLPIDGIVLDIGSGNGEQARYLREHGLNVVTIDPHDADIVGLFPIDIAFRVGAVWCAHTLEHSRNVGLFLDKCFDILDDGGWMAITVPPMKPNIVGGHLTVWNAGLLLYNMILAGFDCSAAKVKTYGYNISVIVQKREAVLPALDYDNGDIEKLDRFFPVPVHQGFVGNIAECNW